MTATLGVAWLISDRSQPPVALQLIHTLALYFISYLNAAVQSVGLYGKGKGKVHPRTGH
jgi:hypothetical protein